jgi:lipoprotein signal peptidase
VARDEEGTLKNYPSIRNRLFWFFFTLAAVVAVDQWVKQHASAPILIPALGSGHSAEIAALVWGLLLVRSLSRIGRASGAECFAFAVLLGGGLSNLGERWVRGYVVNPFHFHRGTGPLISFSLADAGVVLGGLAVCFILLIGILRRSPNRGNLAKTSTIAPRS